MSRAAPGSPYLSVVATSRNDDHGGNLLGRMQLFVDGLAAQCRRHGLEAELVLVEWNPPANRPRLAKALRWPADPGPCQLRIIEVPPSLHTRYRHSEALPLFQMIAKNVGIRRARGRFVLATNIDILFSEPLMAWLARRPLASGRFYRVDRYDVPSPPPAEATPQDRLAWCARHTFRVARRDGIYIRTKLDPDAPFKRTAPIMPALALAKLREAAAAGSGPAGWRHARAVLVAGAKALRALTRSRAIPRLHTFACGDFTLMAREDWLSLRAYPEFEMYSLHIDSALLHQAHRHGLAEHVLQPPMCIYHIEHESGSGWTLEGEAALFDRLRRNGIPWLSDSDFQAIVGRLWASPPDFAFNGSNWGLADETLEEIVPR